SGGAGSVIRCSFAEKLYHTPEGRGYGHRDVWEGAYFRGIGDQWLCDGGEDRRFDTLWWHAGRYIQLEIKTGLEPLTVNRIILEETRYPLEPSAPPGCEDAALDAILA